jgi:hypothetical protein
LNAIALAFRTEIVMSETTKADAQISSETMASGTAQRGGVLERGLLIGGKSVAASSGKVADDVSPWDGEIYAPGRPTPPRPRSPAGRRWGRSSGARSS